MPLVWLYGKRFLLVLFSLSLIGAAIYQRIFWLLLGAALAVHLVPTLDNDVLHK